MLVKILFAVGIFATAWYLIEFFVFIHKFRRDNGDANKGFGIIDSFDINSQFFYFGVIFGWNRMPKEVMVAYKAQILRIRCLCVIIIAAYLPLIVLTGIIGA
ncbi:MAG TPA: hypothetical protein VFK31_03845 [Rhodanobacteraceae bacterium]|nr:hypothetical protein [Rhodanobacteraceae bacterium]